MKERFYKVFANLPIPERSNIIYVSPEHGTMSWYIVNLEVRQDTKLGAEALKALDGMGLI
ncbi:MAG TPA: hypothetical protein ENI13_00095 [candidate division CPR3 bacterium]|uniref:Uncharacterized protein n=1 Tax=candidate division CPR3 bacterium TaxID=2268181 RepID=A0A7C1T7B3_UNCC3|nr:hypothetical protein [candidate division CPR3 bacterium]